MPGGSVITRTCAWVRASPTLGLDSSVDARQHGIVQAGAA